MNEATPKTKSVGVIIGEGQIAVSGTLARVGSSGITTEYPVQLDIPQNTDRD